MAKTIKVPVDEILELSNEIIAFHDAQNQLFEDLQDALEQYRNDGLWQGMDLNMLLLETAVKKQNYHHYMKELKSIAEEMKQFAEAMQDEDLKWKNKILWM